MVAAESDHARQRLAALRGPEFVCVGGWGAVEDVEVPFFYLVQRPGVVVPNRGLLVNFDQDNSQLEFHKSDLERCSHLRGHRNVSAVDHLCPAVKRVCIQRDIVPSAEATSVLEEGRL